MMADVPIGVFLSGGLDSTLALAMVKAQGVEVKAITFYTGFCITETQRRKGGRPDAHQLLGLVQDRNRQRVARAGLDACRHGDPSLTIGWQAKVAALGVIPGNRRPSSGMAWLLVILLAIPMLGERASLEFRPGSPDGRTPRTDYAAAVRRAEEMQMAAGTGEPMPGPVVRLMKVIPIDRGSLRRLPAVVAAVTDRLRAGHTVVAFPEGTTWCGLAYGPFRPAMFQAAVDAGRGEQRRQPQPHRHVDSGHEQPYFILHGLDRLVGRTPLRECVTDLPDPLQCVCVEEFL